MQPKKESKLIVCIQIVQQYALRKTFNRVTDSYQIQSCSTEFRRASCEPPFFCCCNFVSAVLSANILDDFKNEAEYGGLSGGCSKVTTQSNLWGAGALRARPFQLQQLITQIPKFRPIMHTNTQKHIYTHTNTQVQVQVHYGRVHFSFSN